MKNRIYSDIGMGALCLALVSVALFAQQGRTQEKNPEHIEHLTLMQKCAKACGECQIACDGCAMFCSHELQEGHTEHLASLKTCQDCATTCAAAAQIVARRGPFSKAICTACTEACTSCAMECKKFPASEEMKSCAEECLACVQSCNDMLKHIESKKIGME